MFQRAHDCWMESGRRSLSEGQVTVLCAETFFGETCNGGIEQYLFNESGRIASDCAESLRRVGLPKYAAIVEEAIGRCVNEPEENDHGESEDYFDCPDDGSDNDDSPLEDLNERFFAMYFEDKQEFREKLYRYIVDHPQQFVRMP
jgi:hypothetical protein